MKHLIHSNKKLFIALLLLVYLIISNCASFNSINSLPDNYLPFKLKRTSNRFEGSSKYMKGFIISIDLPEDFNNKLITKEVFCSLVNTKQISGILTAPNGKTTPIDFEIVQFKKQDDVYMKTSQGYFLWEQSDFKREKLSFVIYWWYCPPAQLRDIEILNMTESLLSDSTRWNRNDDRICDEDIKTNIWSLFCALKHSSITIMNEYNHHNTAMQTVRNIISDLHPDIPFEHTLMDFNNLDQTKYKDIIAVIKKAKDRIILQLDKKNGI